MNLKYLILGATAVLAISSVTEVVVNPPSAQAAVIAITKSGMFVAAEHPTQGTLRIVNEEGKRYLELDQAFSTQMGPDLHVILHRAASLPKGGLKEQDYVILSRLQQLSGTQRYAIPDNVDLTDYRCAAIWCRKFNATFGYAPLQTTVTYQ